MSVFQGSQALVLTVFRLPRDESCISLEANHTFRHKCLVSLRNTRLQSRESHLTRKVTTFLWGIQTALHLFLTWTAAKFILHIPSTTKLVVLGWALAWEFSASQVYVPSWNSLSTLTIISCPPLNAFGISIESFPCVSITPFNFQVIFGAGLYKITVFCCMLVYTS